MTRAAVLLTNLPRRLFAALGALVLAAACLQAVGPIAAPFERTHGSAFSAATDDVALAQVRRAEAARPALPLSPPTVPPALLAAPLPLPPTIAQPLPRPRSTAPPVFTPLALRPAPRAPPRT